MGTIFVIIGDHKMEKKSCPKCGSDDVATILWGLPIEDPELDKALEEKKIVLGGCVVSKNDPYWECNDCFNRWGKRK